MDKFVWPESLVRPMAGICVLLILSLVSYISFVTTEQGDLTVLYIPFAILILSPYFISSILSLLGTRVSEQRRSNWLTACMITIVITIAPLPFFYEIGGLLISFVFLFFVGLTWFLRKNRTYQALLLSGFGILLVLVIGSLF